MSETIRIAESTLDLTGNGLEYLVDAKGNVIARFINGMLASDIEAAINNEETK